MIQRFRWQPADLSGRGYFYSDLHLGRDPAADSRLLEEVDQLLASDSLPDYLVWGGDTFDFLVGQNRFSIARISPFLRRLRSLQERGVRQWLLEGNHDFHLKWLPENVPDLQVVSDGIQDVDLRLRITHGDGLAPGWLYPRLRHFFRLDSSRALLEILPAALTDRAARRWSQTSYDLRGGGLDPDYLAQITAAFCAHMEAEPNWQWICGHIHDPATIFRPSGRWWINGYWPRHRCRIRIADGRVQGMEQPTHQAGSLLITTL